VYKLITASEIRTMLIPNPNFDTTVLLDNNIESAQKNWLRPLLGDELFNDLIINYASYTNLISGCTYTGTGNYSIVFDGLKKYLAYVTIVEAMPTMFLQLARAGVFKGIVENSERATMDEFSFFKSYYLTKSQEESNFITKYLQENTATYTTFTDPENPKFYGGGILL